MNIKKVIESFLEIFAAFKIHSFLIYTQHKFLQDTKQNVADSNQKIPKGNFLGCQQRLFYRSDAIESNSIYLPWEKFCQGSKSRDSFRSIPRGTSEAAKRTEQDCDEFNLWVC